MSDLNKVFVMGRLTRNAQMKTTQNGIDMAYFSIATNQAKKNQDGTWGQVANFIDLTLYGNRAKATAPYLIQGQQVVIDGHLSQRRWEKDGKKFQRLEVMVDDLKLVGHYQKSDSAKNTRSEETETVTEEYLPPLFEDDDC